MKQEIVNAFDSVTMSVDCEQRIRRAMARKKTARMPVVWKRLATLAAVLALVLCISPEARAAVNRIVRYAFPQSGITIYEGTDTHGNVVGITAVDTEAPPFAQLREGRLVFLGNGENIDITDQITEDDPYIYSYVDDYGLTHYMAVGYSGSIENYGIYEFIREVTEGQANWEGWVTGTGRNFLNTETETRYPWVDIVWQELNIPWPMPE